MHHSSVPSTFAIFFRLSEYFKKIQFFWLFFWRNYFLEKYWCTQKFQNQLLRFFVGIMEKHSGNSFQYLKLDFFNFDQSETPRIQKFSEKRENSPKKALVRTVTLKFFLENLRFVETKKWLLRNTVLKNPHGWLRWFFPLMPNLPVEFWFHFENAEISTG